MVDALDFQIVNALQIYPRISWAQLSRILNVDASTLSRRWQALNKDRLVWTACEEADQSTSSALTVSALVEISCRPGHREEVMTVLSGQGPIFSVHVTSGRRDLYALISMPSLFEMDRYIDEHVATVPHVRSTRTHYFRSIYQEASKWRYAALTASQSLAVERMRPPIMAVEKKEQYRDIVRALSTDFRRPTTEIQQEIGRSVSVVARDLDVVVSADWVRWRVDVAHMLMGWTTAAVLWMNVRNLELDKVGVAMRLLPQVRFCASTTGESNLVVMMWLRDLHELGAIENQLSTAFVNAQVTDRWIVPRIAKRAGHILDDDSRLLRNIPYTTLPLED